MNKIWIIIQREYITRVKRRSFIITTLLAPLGFFALITGSVLITKYSQGRTDIAIVDDSGLFKDIPIPDADDHTVYFHKVSDKYEQLATLLPKEKNEEKKKYSAIIYIPANFDVNKPSSPVIAYRYIERPGGMKSQFINQRMNDAVDKLRMKMLKIDPEVQERMQKKFEVDFTSLDNQPEKKGYVDAATLAGMVMGFAIYISLFFYGTMIMKGVQEEKTSRIVEVLTSSVKPFQLLMGKIMGVGAVGLTQFILWIVLIPVVNIIAGIIFGVGAHPAANMGNLQSSGLDSDDLHQLLQNIYTLPFLQIAILFPLYFLGGFLLYGSLFAAIGAAIGEDSDQQSLMIPVTVPIIISILIAVNVINNPDSSLGFWGSIIPFSSPIVMSALLPFRPEWWQVALSLFLLAGGFVCTTWIAARIYRVGILMYGKKVTLKEMAKWIFAKS